MLFLVYYVWYCLIDFLISGKMQTLRIRHRYSLDPAWEFPPTHLLLLLGVMEGGRMQKEEVSFLQARFVDGETG